MWPHGILSVMNSLNSRRLVIAYNPHSSRASEVQSRVFDRLDEAGYAYETIEVQQAHLNDNVTRLAPLIRPGDIVLSAAGDGSAHAVFHTVLAANQPGVELGFLTFGNFNDIPHVFNSKDTLQDPVAFLENAKPEKVWPINVSVDNRPLRSALLYASIGWTAQAAQQFDAPGVRHSITHGGAGVLRSLWRTGWYYLKTRSKAGLPTFRYNEKTYTKTDLLLVNGPTVARLFRSGKHYYASDVFLFRMLDVRGIVKNIPFLVSGLLGRMKGDEANAIHVEFLEPASTVLQCDGEVVLLEDAVSIEVAKASQPLAVLTTR